MLWLARGLELAPPDADDLQWTLRTALAGWRQQLNAPRPALHHKGAVRAVAYSPDGRYVLTVGDDKVQFWEAATSRPVGSPLPASPLGSYAAFSQDGATFLVTEEGGISLWEMGSGGPAGVRRRFFWKGVATGRLSRDGRYVLTMAAQGGKVWEVQVWDAATAKPVGPPCPIPTRTLSSMTRSLAPTARRC